MRHRPRGGRGAGSARAVTTGSGARAANRDASRSLNPPGRSAPAAAPPAAAGAARPAPDTAAAPVGPGRDPRRTGRAAARTTAWTAARTAASTARPRPRPGREGPVHHRPPRRAQRQHRRHPEQRPGRRAEPQVRRRARGHVRRQHRHRQDRQPEEAGGPAWPAAQGEPRRRRREQRHHRRQPGQRQHGQPGPHRTGRRERRRDAAPPQVAALRADHAHRGVEVAQLPGGQPRHPAAAGRGREHPARGQEHQQRHDPAGQQPRPGEHHRLGRPVARPDPAPPQGHRRGAGRGHEPHRHAEQRHRPRPSARAHRVRGHAVQPAEQRGDQRGERLHSCPPPAVAPSRCPRHGPGRPVSPLWHHACGGRQRRSPPTRSGPSRDDRPSPRSSAGSTAPLPGCGAVGWSCP